MTRTVRHRKIGDDNDEDPISRWFHFRRHRGAPPARRTSSIEDGTSSTSVRAGWRRRRRAWMGARCCPGLFDSHVHFTMSGELDPVKLMMRPFSLRYFEAAANMEATLRTGITSVREAGGSDLA